MNSINVRPKLFSLAIAWLICGAAAFPVESAEHRYKNLKEAVSAARNAKDENEMTTRYSELSEYSAETPDDVRSLYEAMAELESKVKDRRQAQKTALPIGKLIEKSTDPKHHQVIAELLERENQALTANYFGSLAPLPGKEEDAKEAIRTARLMVLTKAAGDGKNRLALPALRSMFKKGGITAEFASDAIGKIGDPQDLDAFIDTIKKDPKARLGVGSFGAVAVDRIMREIDDPTVPGEQKQRLIPYLEHPAVPKPEDLSATHYTITKYVPLLHHKNLAVVKAAARSIGMNVRPEDEPLVLDMIRDPNGDVRVEGLMAIDRIWSEHFLPKVVELLKNDPQESVRASAAQVLGQRRVRSAEGALRDALKDRSSWVRSSAQGALDNVTGESERQALEYLKKRKEKTGY